MFICEKGFNCVYCTHTYSKDCGHILEVKPVVRGHWDGNDYPVCSECGRPALSEKTNIRAVDRFYNFDGRTRFYTSVSYDTVYRKTTFCPHCGAKMCDLVKECDGNG